MYVNSEAAGRLMRPPLKARTVRNHCKSGRLPAKRIGRDWYVEVSDAKAFEVRPAGRPTDAERKARELRDAKRAARYAAREAARMAELEQAHG